MFKGGTVPSLFAFWQVPWPFCKRGLTCPGARNWVASLIVFIRTLIVPRFVGTFSCFLLGFCPHFTLEPGIRRSLKSPFRGGLQGPRPGACSPPFSRGPRRLGGDAFGDCTPSSELLIWATYPHVTVPVCRRALHFPPLPPPPSPPRVD